MIRHNFMWQQNIVIVILLSLIAVYASAGSQTNAIDTLVKELNSAHYDWMDGKHPVIRLSSNATPEEVISNAVVAATFVKDYRILECRRVHFRDNMLDCFAALIDSDLGKKILLFQYEACENGKGFWLSHFYDVPKPAKPTTSPSPAR